MSKIVFGKIVNTFGIKGELKVLMSSSNFSLLKPLDDFFIDGFDEIFKCERISNNGKFVKIKIFGFDDINLVEIFKNHDIVINCEQKELKDNQFLTADLIGAKLVDGKKEIAEVKDVQNFGATDILILNVSGKEMQVPFVDEYIGDVDIKTKTINITKNFYEGLVWRLTF